MPELHAFVEVARLGSVSAAAQSLCMTQGGISRTLLRLEQHVGCTLFVRSAHGAALTPAGRRFLDKVLPGLALLDEAVRSLGTATPRREVLRLSVIPTLAMRWLIPRLPLFHARFPSLRIMLKPYVTDDDFLREDVDGWLQTRKSSRSLWPGHVRATYVTGREIVAICHPSVVAGIRSPSDLLRYPLLHHVNYPDNWRVWLAGTDAGEPPELGSGFDLIAGLVEAVSANLGVAVVQRCVIEPDLLAGRVVIPLAHQASTGRGYFFCVPRAIEHDETLQAFRGWLEACAAAGPGGPAQADDSSVGPADPVAAGVLGPV